MSPFWRGFGSALSLGARCDRPRLRVKYQGRDLAKISAGEALRSDWTVVVNSIEAASGSERQRFAEVESHESKRVS